MMSGVLLTLRVELAAEGAEGVRRRFPSLARCFFSAPDWLASRCVAGSDTRNNIRSLIRTSRNQTGARQPAPLRPAARRSGLWTAGRSRLGFKLSTASVEVRKRL